MDIDVLGSYNTLKATLPHLIRSASRNPNDGVSASPGGRIIFVSATLHYRATPLQVHVGVAKAGVDALSASCAIEFGPQGVTSNIIAPGPIGGTEGADRLIGKRTLETWKKGVPLGRLGTVKEIADATVYLFSDAGNFVNGNVLVVDGGQWRAPEVYADGEVQYPQLLLGGLIPEGAKGGKKDLKSAKL